MAIGKSLWMNLIAAFVFAAALTFSPVSSDGDAGFGSALAQQNTPGLESNPTEGTVPGGVQGNESDGSIWNQIRQGAQGTVSIPDRKAGQLIQSQGQDWRAFRLGPLMKYGAWALLGIIALLALFYLIRGRIRIEAGPSGKTITRFSMIERMGHWLLAVSFIILGLTGLNVLYGRYVLLPVLGPDAFGAITIWGKYLHNYVGFAFMLGLVMVFVMWVIHNFPRTADIKWILQGGGMFSKGSHPPAHKFNAGQKIIFWAVILCGASLSLSGIALMFPFEMALFAKTFAFLNNFGFDLPTALTPIQEMQLSQSWHSILSLLLIVVVIAHIYIGTIGMEGAFDAMGTGEVDTNWAKEHHSLWVEDMKEDAKGKKGGSKGAAGVPAE